MSEVNLRVSFFHLILTVKYTATYNYLLMPQQVAPISPDPQLQQISQYFAV